MIVNLQSKIYIVQATGCRRVPTFEINLSRIHSCRNCNGFLNRTCKQPLTRFTVNIMLCPCFSQNGKSFLEFILLFVSKFDLKKRKEKNIFFFCVKNFTSKKSLPGSNLSSKTFHDSINYCKLVRWSLPFHFQPNLIFEAVAITLKSCIKYNIPKAQYCFALNVWSLLTHTVPYRSDLQEYPTGVP